MVTCEPVDIYLDQQDKGEENYMPHFDPETQEIIDEGLALADYFSEQVISFRNTFFTADLPQQEEQLMPLYMLTVPRDHAKFYTEQFLEVGVLFEVIRNNKEETTFRFNVDLCDFASLFIRGRNWAKQNTENAHELFLPAFHLDH